MMSKKTSVLYNFGNYKLEYDVIHDYGRICGVLNSGPDALKEYLVGLWNETREGLMNSQDVNVLDIQRVVSTDDFDVSYNLSSKKEPVFFITLPDYNNNISESKCIAVAITEEKPRFFSMQYNKNDYSFSEIEFKYLTNKFVSNDFGLLEKNTITYFATRVLDMLN